MPPVTAYDRLDIVFINGAGWGACLHGIAMFLKSLDGDALALQRDLLVGDNG